MDTFTLFFKQGLNHILDLDGLDHTLFILAMVVYFEIKEWRKLLILVTAFTLGHSITLALSLFEVIDINRDLVEVLIPLTIIITCFNNIFRIYNKNQSNYNILYSLVLGFGCIHGLAFSNFLQMSLFDDESIATPLLGFNIGIELGQLLVVILMLLITTLLVNISPKINHKHISLTVSILTICISLYIIYNLLTTNF